MLYRGGAEIAANRIVHSDAGFAVVAEHADFNQAVRIQAKVDLFEDSRCQARFANDDDRLQRVCFGAQCAALYGCKF